MSAETVEILVTLMALLVFIIGNFVILTRMLHGGDVDVEI